MHPARVVQAVILAIGFIPLAASVRAQAVVVRPHESGGIEVAPPAASDGSRVLPWGIEHVVAMRDGQTLRIQGVIGSVRMRRATFRDLASFTVVRADGGPAPRVVVLPGPTGVTVCAVYPSPNPTKPNVCLADGKAQLTEGLQQDWPEVTFEVGVPDGVNVAVHVVTGDIRAEAPTGRHVNLKTGKGRIAVVDYGAAGLRADSMAGDVELTLAPRPLTAMRTVSSSVAYGTLHVLIPAATPIRFYVSGRVSSAFPLQRTVAHHYSEGTLGLDTGPYVTMRLSADPPGTIDIRSADDPP